MEAIEEIARALKLQKLMLCSTNDPVVKSTWHHLNFDFASEEDMKEWDIPHADLVYLQNTTQVGGCAEQGVLASEAHTVTRGGSPWIQSREPSRVVSFACFGFSVRE